MSREKYTGPQETVAEFTLTAGTELPEEILRVLEARHIPHYLIHTDSPQPVRLLTSTGIYTGRSIEVILNSPEFAENPDSEPSLGQ
jgi:hypothetical protein